MVRASALRLRRRDVAPISNTEFILLLCPSFLPLGMGKVQYFTLLLNRFIQDGIDVTIFVVVPLNCIDGSNSCVKRDLKN